MLGKIGDIIRVCPLLSISCFVYYGPQRVLHSERHLVLLAPISPFINLKDSGVNLKAKWR